MGLGNLNSDEFDTLFDILLLILFMSFGIFAIASMSRLMNDKIEVIDRPDKIAITLETHEEKDPFYFTGYQSYMFAWHMDDASTESLSWVGGKLNVDYDIVENNIQSKQRLDNANHLNCVTLCALDSDGDYITPWLTWRNQMITGTGVGSSRSVRKAINSLIETDNSNTLKQLYRGTFTESSGSRKLRWHLTLTDKYIMNNDLGYSVIDGGKTFRWVLEPTYR